MSAIRGRPRKTDAEKKRQGTYRKDRKQPDPAPFALISKAPPAPEQFSDDAKAVWKTITTELVNLKLLTTVDIFVLEMLVREVEKYWQAEKMIMEEGLMTKAGTGALKKHPALDISAIAWRNVMQAISHYGLSPAARQRLKVVLEPPKKNKALELMK